MSRKSQIIALIASIPAFKGIVSKMRVKKWSSSRLSQREIERAESDPEEKKRIVQKANEKWPSASRDERIAYLFANAPDFMSLSKEEQQALKQDMLFCRFAYGIIATEYLCYHFMAKDTKARKTFISESDHMSLCYRMNDPVDINIFNDKMRTYERFKKYYHREIIPVSRQSDFQRFSAYVKAHPVFVKKQVAESCGNSIEKIDARSCGKSERELFESFLKQGKVVLEELVEQGAATACFNASSVNTIRCITVNTKKGVLTPYCFMKIGRKGAFVDNGGAGGILVGIDEKTGMTNTVGYDELRRIYERHPDSGVAFVGHQLPEWDRMIAICKEMASQIPTVRFIGWDLAYTDDKGWVVIEGNGMSQFIGPQTIWQRGIKEEVMQFMKDMDL